MTFERFKHIVNRFVSANNGMVKRFFNDVETGRFIALCSDDYTIIGNSTSIKWTIRDKHGNHQFMFDASKLDVAV